MLSDSTIFNLGGVRQNFGLDGMVESLDLTNVTAGWSERPSMTLSAGRRCAAAAYLPSTDLIYVYGGCGSMDPPETGVCVNYAWSYSVSTYATEWLPEFLGRVRSAMPAVALSTGTVSSRSGLA